MSRKTIKYSFDNGRGQKLSAVLDTPEGEPDFYGVFAPCFTCVKESHGAAKISRAMAELNIGMMRFDMTGLGDSEGDFADTNFTTRIADITAACEAVARDFAPPALLVGHSISGTASLAAQAAVPSLQAIATVGAPADPAHIIDKFRRQNAITPKGNGMIDIIVMGQRISFRESFIDDMLAQDVEEVTRAIDRRLFVFHAPHDNIVHYDNAELIVERAAKADAELIALSDAATHLFETRKEDAIFVAETLAQWFRTHLR